MSSRAKKASLLAKLELIRLRWRPRGQPLAGAARPGVASGSASPRGGRRNDPAAPALPDSPRLTVAIGVAAAVLDGWLDALCRAVNYTAPTAFWVKLHLGDPGSAGTGSPAANTTRQQASFAAASGGSAVTRSDLNWTSVPNAETYSHVSFWTAPTSGTFLGSDDLATPRTVVIGDNFTTPTGSLSVGITPVAA